MTPIVFLDTETTGVHQGRRVWEVAMIRRDETGEREIQFFIAANLSNADPFGLKIGGYYDRHPNGQQLSGTSVTSRSVKYEDEAARIVAAWTHGAHIVGAVPNFDTETLAPLLREYGLAPAWHYHLIDIEALMVGYLAGQGVTLPGLPWRSDDLSTAIGVKPATDEERHTAMGDTRWTMRVYDKVMGAA
jgi:hypothetical protein